MTLLSIKIKSFPNRNNICNHIHITFLEHDTQVYCGLLRIQEIVHSFMNSFMCSTFFSASFLSVYFLFLLSYIVV